jgi:hypothetical protein
MGYELENQKIGNEVDSSVNSTKQAVYSEMIKGRGIASATINYRPFKFGILSAADPTQIYRKFFYNDEGRVIKKFEFDSDGGIKTKEESIFDAKDKSKILQTNIISTDGSFMETYEYNTVKENNKLNRYSFFSSKWPRPKEETYDYDRFGRINKKTSYGIIGEPELITHYLYDTDKDTKVTYWYVTTPDGELVITLLNDYDSKKQTQTALYSFLLTPEEITELRKSDKKNWELKSRSRSRWEYDANGNNIGFQRDEMFSRELSMGMGFDMISNRRENPTPEERPRILVEKNSSDYEKLDNQYYLVRTTEWLANIDEPLKAVKEYTYMDKDGGIIYEPKT